MRFPDFIIIGAQKAGTTWLGSRLSAHPDIFLPRPYEVHFFDVERNWRAGREWYAEKFAAASSAQAAGEKTPDYLWVNRPSSLGSGNIARRLHETVPEAKLIVILRDPVERAVSAFYHQVRARKISPFLSPARVLLGDDSRLRERFGFLSRGHYAEQLERYLSLFERDQVRVYFFEDDIQRNGEETFRDVCAFLGVSSQQSFKQASRPENRGLKSQISLAGNYYMPKLAPIFSAIDPYMPKRREGLDAPGRARLQDYFAPHNARLFRLLGRSAHWPEAGQ